jgi:predicted dehydrogenase
MNVAVLGLGFMGAMHAKAWRSVKGATLAGVMSSDTAKLSGDLRRIRGNLGGAGERVDFGAARRYPLVESALADSSIDAVDICLPTDLHAPVALAALRAGKHVLVEKPIALDFASASEVSEAAEKAGLVLMAGHVLRFIPAWNNLANWVKGRKVESALFQRRCGVPAWSGWLGDPARSGGAVLDLLIHDIDFCISVWGMPEFASAKGSREAGVDLVHAQLFYPECGPVVIEGGWHQPWDYPFSMEYAVTADGLTCEWSSASGDTSDPFTAELQYFADCVSNGKAPDLCPPHHSAQAVALARFILESRTHDGKAVRTS